MIIKPAKKLSELLQTKVILDKASSAFLKLGESKDLHQYHLCKNSEDKFLVNYGVGIDDFAFELTEDQAFENLASRIGEWKKVKFHLLWLPVTKAINHCAAEIHENVIVRAIEYYEIRIDEMLTRYDVLVQALD